MATLVRSAKSGSLWTPHDLRVFNIQVVRQDTQTFFGGDLPIQTPNAISPTIWNNVHLPPPPPGNNNNNKDDDDDNDISKPDIDFFAFLEDATLVPPSASEGDSLVNDFAVFLLKMLHYDDGRRVVHTRTEMPFCMCGEQVDATADVVVVDRKCPPLLQPVLLLLVEDKSYQSGSDPPDPHIIATALGAFSQTNLARERAGLPCLESYTFPAITMVGSSAAFYKIPISASLVFAVERGEYPSRATVVQKLVPPVPDLAGYPLQGMLPLENRRIVLRCFEAFKQFLDNNVVECDDR